MASLIQEYLQLKKEKGLPPYPEAIEELAHKLAPAFAQPLPSELKKPEVIMELKRDPVMQRAYQIFIEENRKKPGFFENVVHEWKLADLATKRGKIWHDVMMGRKSPTEALEETSEVEAELKKMTELYERPAWYSLKGATGSAASLARYWISGIPQAIKWGAIGGLVGAGAAVVGGMAGPQAVVPEEVITVPVAGALGAKLGAAFGIAKHVGEIEGGNLYKDLIDQGIDPRIAKPLAAGAGALMGVIEVMQLEGIIPARKFLQSTIGKRLINKVLGDYAKVVAEEIGEEMAQELTQAGAEAVAGMISQRPDVIPRPSEVANRLVEVAKQIGPGLALTAGIGRAAGLGMEMRGLRRAAEAEVARIAQARSNLVARAKEKGISYEQLDNLSRQVMGKSVEELNAEETAQLAQQLEMPEVEAIRPTPPELAPRPPVVAEHEAAITPPETIPAPPPEAVAEVPPTEVTPPEEGIPPVEEAAEEEPVPPAPPVEETRPSVERRVDVGKVLLELRREMASVDPNDIDRISGIVRRMNEIRRQYVEERQGELDTTLLDDDTIRRYWEFLRKTGGRVGGLEELAYEHPVLGDIAKLHESVEIRELERLAGKPFEQLTREELDVFFPIAHELANSIANLERATRELYPDIPPEQWEEKLREDIEKPPERPAERELEVPVGEKPRKVEKPAERGAEEVTPSPAEAEVPKIIYERPTGERYTVLLRNVEPGEAREALARQGEGALMKDDVAEEKPVVMIVRFERVPEGEIVDAGLSPAEASNRILADPELIAIPDEDNPGMMKLLRPKAEAKQVTPPVTEEKPPAREVTPPPVPPQVEEKPPAEVKKPAPRRMLIVSPEEKRELIKQVQEVMKDAPETADPGAPMLDFELAGTKIRVANSKESLREFLKRLQKLPTRMEVGGRAKGIPKPRAARTEKLEPLYKTPPGYFSDGKLIVKGEPPKKAKYAEEAPKVSMEKIREFLDAPTRPAVKLYYYYANQDTEGVAGIPMPQLEKRALPPVVIFKFEDEEGRPKYVAYDQFRFNVIANRYPDAEFGIAPRVGKLGGVLVAYKDGEPVAALLSMRLELDKDVAMDVPPGLDMAIDAGLISREDVPGGELDTTDGPHIAQELGIEFLGTVRDDEGNIIAFTFRDPQTGERFQAASLEDARAKIEGFREARAKEAKAEEHRERKPVAVRVVKVKSPEEGMEKAKAEYSRVWDALRGKAYEERPSFKLSPDDVFALKVNPDEMIGAEVRPGRNVWEIRVVNVTQAYYSPQFFPRGVRFQIGRGLDLFSNPIPRKKGVGPAQALRQALENATMSVDIIPIAQEEGGHPKHVRYYFAIVPQLEEPKPAERVEGVVVDFNVPPDQAEARAQARGGVAVPDEAVPGTMKIVKPGVDIPPWRMTVEGYMMQNPEFRRLMVEAAKIEDPSTLEAQRIIQQLSRLREQLASEHERVVREAQARGEEVASYAVSEGMLEEGRRELEQKFRELAEAMGIKKEAPAAEEQPQAIYLAARGKAIPIQEVTVEDIEEGRVAWVPVQDPYREIKPGDYVRAKYKYEDKRGRERIRWYEGTVLADEDGEPLVRKLRGVFTAVMIKPTKGSKWMPWTSDRKTVEYWKAIKAPEPSKGEAGFFLNPFDPETWRPGAKSVEELYREVEAERKRESKATKRQKAYAHILAKGEENLNMSDEEWEAFKERVLGERKSMRDMTEEEADRIIAALEEEMRKQGKEVKGWDEFEADIIDAVELMKEGARITDQALRKLARMDRGVRRLFRGKGFKTRMWLYSHFLRPERICNMLDGWREGPTTRRVWNEAYNAALSEVKLLERFIRDVKQITEEEGIDWGELYKPYFVNEKYPTMTRSRAMWVYANSQHEDNLRHLHATGYTDQDIAAIVGSLEDKYKRVVDRIIDYFDQEIYPIINAAYRERFGKDLPRVEGRYFPIMFLEDVAAQDPLEYLDVEMDRTRRRNIPVEPESGMTMPRKKGVQPFDEDYADFFTVVGRHLWRSAHYAAFKNPIARIKAYLTDDRIRQTIKAVYGRRLYRVLTRWLEHLAWGKDVARDYEAWEDVAAFMRQNFALATLGINLVSALKQPVSFMLGAEEIGPVAAAEGLMRMIKGPEPGYKGPLGAWRFVKEKSVMMRKRDAGFNKELYEMRSGREPGLLPKHPLLRKLRDLPMELIRALDRATVTALWLGAYYKVKSSGQINGREIPVHKIEEEAIKYADRVIRRTQPMAGIENLADFYRGSELKKMFTIFSNQLNQNFNVAVERFEKFYGDLRKYGITDRRTAQTLWNLSQLALIFLMSSYLISLLSRKRQFWETPKGYIMDLISQVFGTIPLVRWLTRSWGAITPFESLVSNLRNAIFSRKPMTRLKNALYSLSMLTGIPYVQLRRLIIAKPFGEREKVPKGRRAKRVAPLLPPASLRRRRVRLQPILPAAR